MGKEWREIFAFYSRSLTRGKKVLYLERSIVASIFLWRQHPMMVTPLHYRQQTQRLLCSYNRERGQQQVGRHGEGGGAELGGRRPLLAARPAPAQAAPLTDRAHRLRGHLHHRQGIHLPTLFSFTYHITPDLSTSMWVPRDNSTFPQHNSHVWWRIGVSRKFSPGNYCTVGKISGEFTKALKKTFLGLKTFYIFIIHTKE